MKNQFLKFVIFLSIFKAIAQDVENILLPPPTIIGTQSVGRIKIILEDTERVDIAAPKPTNRQFNIQIWYPSNKKNKTAPLITDIEKYRNLLGAEEYQRFGRTKISVLEYAPISNKYGNYPVLLFSPGFGMNKAYYSSFCHYLAQNNFVVVAIDHPYMNKSILKDGNLSDPENGYFDSFPATKPASSVKVAKAKFQKLFDYFNADVDFIVERLHALNNGGIANGLLKNRLDLGKMAHIGHSAGSLVTKSLMSRVKTNFSAFVTFDVRLDQEFLSATEQVEIPNNTVKPILMFALEYVQQYAPYPTESFLKNRKGDFHHIALKNTGHNAMSDLDYIYFKEKKDLENANNAEEKMLGLFLLTSNFLKTYLN